MKTTSPLKEKGGHLEELRVNQDRPPNWRTDGRLFLVRCFACDPKRGRENYAMSVSSGVCAWCDWQEKEKENADGSS